MMSICSIKYERQAGISCNPRRVIEHGPTVHSFRALPAAGSAKADRSLSREHCRRCGTLRLGSAHRGRFAMRTDDAPFRRACARAFGGPLRAPAEIASAAYWEVLRESANDFDSRELSELMMRR